MARRGSGAAPGAAFAVRPFGFGPLTPPRRRRCALCWPPGKGPTGYPRRAGLAPLDTVEPAAPDRPGQRPAACAVLGGCAVACCGKSCEYVPSSTLAVLAHHVTKDGSRTSRPASLWSFCATPEARRRKVRRGRSRLSSGG